MPFGDRTVSVGLQAKVGGFVSGMRLAQKSASDFSNNLTRYGTKNKAALNDVSRGAGIAGAALLGLGIVAIKQAADFDQGMSKVRAATHETAANMNRLRDAALEAGARTVFSATEAAGAEEALAKAGVSTADILGGALNGALDLASAGELDVADAAEVAATAMTQFKLSGKDVPHIADLLAAGAGKAQGEVSDMAQALKQAGLVASNAGLSIEDTTGTLAAFASAGLIGSDAGTSFRTMLLRLQNPTGEAKDLLDKYNISAYDSEGHFVTMESLAGQLKTGLGGLSEEQRNAALATIFGSDAIRGATVLYSQGAAGIDKWVKKVNDSGYAAETAAIKLDNLSGDFEKLRGALSTALIGAAEGEQGPLRTLTQNLTHLVDEFNNLPAPIKEATLLLVGGAGLTLLGVAGMAKLIVSISGAVRVMKELQITTGRTAALMKAGLFAAGFFAVAEGVSYLGKSIHGLHASNAEWTKDLEKLNRTGKVTGDVAKFLGKDFDRLGKDTQQAINPSLHEKVDAAVLGFLHLGSSVSNARDGFKKLDKTLTETNAEDAAKSYETIRQKLLGLGYSQEQINSLFPKYNKHLRDAKKGNEELAGVTEETVGAAGDQADAVSDAAQALQDMDDRAQTLKDTLDLLNGTMGNLDAESAYEDAIDAATGRIKDFHKEVKKGDDATKGMKNALDLTTEAGRNNYGVISDLWKRTGDYAEQIYRTTGDQAAANAVLKDGRTQLVNVLAGFLGSKEAAEKYVEQVLHIPKNVTTKYSTPGLTEAERKARLLKETANYLNGKKVSTQFITEHIDYQRTIGVTSSGRDFRQFDSRYNRAKGGYIGGLAAGGRSDLRLTGMVAGPGTGTSDTAGIFALSNGEFVSTAKSTTRNRSALEAGNRGAELMVRGRDTSSSYGMGGQWDGSGMFEGNLFLDSGEFLGVVQGQMTRRDRDIRRRAMAGTGAAR